MHMSKFLYPESYTIDINLGQAFKQSAGHSNSRKCFNISRLFGDLYCTRNCARRLKFRIDFAEFIHLIRKRVTCLRCSAWSYGTVFVPVNMMTSSNENIFRVTDPLCGEFTGHRWIPLTNASDAELYVFFDLRLNKWLSKQSRRRWFETPSRSLWYHCNEHWFYLFSTCLRSVQIRINIIRMSGFLIRSTYLRLANVITLNWKPIRFPDLASEISSICKFKGLMTLL